jgi:hypothetical protein
MGTLCYVCTDVFSEHSYSVYFAGVGESSVSTEEESSDDTSQWYSSHSIRMIPGSPDYTAT